jgi:large subunit ribosomal protein L15
MDLKQLHALPSVKKRPDRKRVGRGPGSGMGKRSTRGQKGAGARSGWRRRDFYEGGQTPLMRRLPKRGFSNDPFTTTRFAVVNLAELNRFEDGAEVTVEALRKAGLIRRTHDGVKILGDGNLEKKLKVTAHRFSKSAIEKIQARGGEAIALRPPVAKKPRNTAAPKAKKKGGEEGGE